MITFLAQTFNIVASVIQYFLQLASFVGQVIVVIVTTILSFIANSIKSIFLFFQIVYEDNVFIFTEELPQWTSQYFETMHNQYSSIHNVLWTLCSQVQVQITSTISSIKYIVDTFLMVTLEVLILLKKSVLLIGNALWLMLTFLPIHLPYLIKTLTKYVKETAVTVAINIYTVLLRFTNFLSDVPLESFIGIMTAIAIARFYLSFQMQIHSKIINVYWIIIRKMWYLYHSVYNYFTNPDVRIITRVASGEAIISRDANFEEEDDDDVASAADALCVICQERQKCVLILPCKHVCLCRECCLRLYGYQRTCPICRTFIYHSVTIYL
ncbi:unnamed protein product [Colias eurytheme]|nr:unnamed protein product [Colias eurytheme]